MKRIFMDCEFNGFGGKLMSLALVPEDPATPYFYRELEMKDQLEPWVRENVVPHMFMVPISRSQFQQDLANYLWKIGDCTIIADWPDDIRYFCESLITGPGMSLNLLHNIGFYLDFGIQYESAGPHNALHDAMAIRDHYIKMGK
jgi:hypothetical protein